MIFLKYSTWTQSKSVIFSSLSKFDESVCLRLFFDDELEICPEKPGNVAFSSSVLISRDPVSSVSGTVSETLLWGMLSAMETSSHVIPPSVSILWDGFFCDFKIYPAEFKGFIISIFES
jgi:hypothetical protein